MRSKQDGFELLSFEDDGLDEVLEAMEDGRYTSPPIVYSGRLITFVSRRGVTSDFKDKFREFQTYVRARFGVRLVVVGGGVGCQKVTVLPDGAKQDIEVALDWFRQMPPALLSRLQSMGFDFITDEKTKHCTFVEKPGALDKKPAPGEKFHAEGFESVESLIAKINLERVELKRALIPQAGGADTYEDYSSALDAALASLLRPGLVDEDAFTRLKSIGKTILRVPGASAPSERILGSVQRIAGQRLTTESRQPAGKGRPAPP